MPVPVRLLAVLLCALSLAGCLIETKNSIIVDPLPIDESISGNWAFGDEDGVALLIIRPDEDDPALAKVAYVFIEPGEDDIDVGRTLFDVRLTQIGDATYFEAVPRGLDAFPDDSNPVGLFIGRVKVADSNTLEVEMPDPDQIREAVEAGRVEGEIDKSNLNRSVTLTGTTDEMRRFLEALPLSDDQIPLVYHRIE